MDFSVLKRAESMEAQGVEGTRPGQSKRNLPGDLQSQGAGRWWRVGNGARFA